MIQLKRQQVKALLDIVSKDNMRRNIENVKIIEYREKMYLTGTDGYVMLMLEVENKNLLGRAIHRTEIERWYKLATGKDYLTEEALDGMHYTDEDFPKVESIVDNALVGAPSDVIGFNADYAKKVQTLFGVGGLTLKLNGKMGAMVFENKSNDNKGYGIIMPLKV